MMPSLKPFFEQVQAHYDLSDEFFGLFLDPSWTYSCAYFEDDTKSLEEAQIAKIEISINAAQQMVCGHVLVKVE